jgi:hypothetical protein
VRSLPNASYERLEIIDHTLRIVASAGDHNLIAALDT